MADGPQTSDDFAAALALLSNHASSSSRVEDEGGDGGTDEAPAPGSDAAEAPYWRSGAALDISQLLEEPQQLQQRRRDAAAVAAAAAGSKSRAAAAAVAAQAQAQASARARAALALDPAVTDPNPPPPLRTQAVMPPDALMHPAANIALNRRLETAMLNNEVQAAQRIASTAGQLEQLCEEPLFARACVAALGLDTPHALLPRPRASFRVNPETGRLRRPEEIDALVAKGEVDRVKKLALVLTDFRQLALEAERARVKVERERVHEFIANKGQPLRRRSPAPSAEEDVTLESESGVEEAVAEAGDAPPPLKAPPPPPKAAFSRDMIAKWGLPALQKHGFKTLEKFGLKLCERWGSRALEDYRLEHLEKFGVALLDKFGPDACVRHGKQALQQYPIELLDLYGELACAKYPLDLLVKYAPDVLDVWPHTLLREFPLEQLVLYPLDLLRRYPISVLERHPIDVLRKFPLPKIEFYGPALLRAFPLEALDRYGKEVCDEALRVELEPATVAAYHAERMKREQRIHTAGGTLSEIHNRRFQAVAFTRTAPGNDGPTPAMMAAQRLAEQQAAALKLVLEENEALERAQAEARRERERAELTAQARALERADAERQLLQIRAQSAAIAVAKQQAESLVQAHAQAQARALAHVEMLSHKNDLRRMEDYKLARERAQAGGLLRKAEVAIVTDDDKLRESVDAGVFKFGRQ